MKELLSEWMLNLTLFSLLSSLIMRLLPGKTYLPYIRIFCGIMMILILFQPLLRLGGLEERMEKLFVEEIYETERRQMENKLMRIEKEQRRNWEEKYQKFIEDYNSEDDKKNKERQSDGVEKEDERID